MQVTKTKVGPCKYRLRVDVEAERVDQAFDQAFRELARVTAVPGFRRGKAPRAIVERYVNEDRLKELTLDFLARPALREALASEELDVWGQPDVTFGDLVKGEPWSFEVLLATNPVVTLADLSGLSVERPVVRVTDEDVDRSLHALREQHAVEEPVTDRGAEIGDVVFADLTFTSDDDEEHPIRGNVVRLGATLPELEQGMVGQKPGETREIKIRFPEDYPDSTFAGRSGTMTVTVQSIARPVLPEPTDEWIREIGAGESLEDYRRRERERLQATWDSIADQAVRTRAIELLAQKSGVEYPDELLDIEVDYVLAEIASDLRRHGITYEQYLSAANLSRDEHEQQIEAEAKRRLILKLVLREFARQENLQLTEEEIAAAVERSARIVASGQAPEEATQESQARSIMNRMLWDKIGDRLLTVLQVVDKEVERTAETGGQEA